MKFKFRHAEKIVGLFALIALALLVIIVLFAGINKKWFEKKIYFHSMFTSAQGLKVGMPVTLRGFEIGKVRKIALNEGNLVDLEFYVFETYHDRMRPNSVIALPSGLLGSSGTLELYPGFAGGEPVPEGSYIPSTQTREGKALVKSRKVDRPDSGDAIADVINRLPIIADSIEGIVLALENGLKGEGGEALASTMRNVMGITATLDNTVGNIDAIAASLAALAGELESPQGLVPTLFDPSGSLDTLLNDNDVLWEQILSILDQVDKSVSGLYELSVSLVDLSPQLALTLDEVIRSLEEAQKVMEGLKNNPLLKRGISPETRLESTGTDIRQERF